MSDLVKKNVDNVANASAYPTSPIATFLTLIFACFYYNNHMNHVICKWQPLTMDFNSTKGQQGQASLE